MKTFTKNLLVTSLLLASTSALSLGLMGPPSTPSPADSTASQTLPGPHGIQSTQILSWMSTSPVELKFKNDGNYIVAAIVTYQRKDKVTGKYAPDKEIFTLGVGDEKIITLQGDDALVKVAAETGTAGEPLRLLMDRNLCTYNNQYFNPNTGKLGTRKDITFFAGTKDAPEMVAYPTEQLRKDGYNNLNLGNFECWVDQPISLK